MLMSLEKVQEKKKKKKEKDKEKNPLRVKMSHASFAYWRLMEWNKIVLTSNSTQESNKTF